MDQRFIETGKDSVGLGIWVWTRLQGNNIAIIMLSTYRPYKLSTWGIQTVYGQHAMVLLLNQEPRS